MALAVSEQVSGPWQFQGVFINGVGSFRAK